MRSAQAVAVSIGTANGKAVSLSGATCSGRSCGPGVPRDAQRSWAPWSETSHCVQEL